MVQWLYNVYCSLFLIFVTETISITDDINPNRNIFSINVELTSTFLLYRGLVHHHHRILNAGIFLSTNASETELKDV